MKKYFALLPPLLLAATLLAQTSQGTDFWFTYLKFPQRPSNKTVMVSAPYPTRGTVKIPGTGFRKDFTVAAGEVTILYLPEEAESPGSEQLNPNGVHLTTDRPVSVYIHHFDRFRAEASMVLPTPSLGREYYTMSYVGHLLADVNSDHVSEFSVVATEDGTKVVIDGLKAPTERGLADAGGSLTVRMNRGETYQVRARRHSDDFTGTRVRADKPITVFSGNEWTQIPADCGFRDNLLEVMYPVSTLGREYVALPSARVNGNIYRVLATEDGTVVEIDGNGTDNDQTITLDRAEWAAFERSDAFIVRATAAVQVAQYNKGESCSGHTVGDPAMLLLSSARQTLDTVTVFNSNLQHISENYLGILLRAGDEAVTELDGRPLAGPFLPVADGSEFVYTVAKVEAGPHTVVSRGCGVVVTAYGYGRAESYAYGGGAAFRNLNANPIPEGGCRDEEIVFNAGLDTARYRVRWTLGDGSVRTERTFRRAYPEVGSYPVELIVTDRCLGGADTSRREVRVTLQQAVALGEDATVCEGEAVVFWAEDRPGATYQWTGPGGYATEAREASFLKARRDQSGPYVVVGSIYGCQTVPDTNWLTVHPTPEVTVVGDTSFCGERDGGVKLTTRRTYVRYDWSDGTGEDVAKVDRAGPVSVMVMDDNGCWGEGERTVREFCATAVYLPTAFSPNGDGANDVYEVHAVDAEAVRLRVFDRWGGLVFEGRDEGAVWDGRVRGGRGPTGAYAVVVEVTGVDSSGRRFTEVRRATVNLLR